MLNTFDKENDIANLVSKTILFSNNTIFTMLLIVELVFLGYFLGLN